MKNFVIQNWIALLSLGIALSGFALTVWLNRIALVPSFKWFRSKNDNSWKLRILIINMSPRTTLLLSLVLKQKKRSVSDNGYDYDAVEERLQDEQYRLEEQEHKERLAKANHSPYSMEETMENIRYSKISRNHLLDQSKSLLASRTFVSDERESLSNNFDDPVTIFGNSHVDYSYWLDTNDIPDRLVLTFTRLLPIFKKSKSFKIPHIPQEVEQNANVKNQDDEV